MAIIRIRKPHQQETLHVRQKVQELAEKLSQESALKYSWNDNQLNFELKGANGHIDIDNRQVKVEIKLNLLLSPMKGKIEKTISDYLDENLA